MTRTSQADDSPPASMTESPLVLVLDDDAAIRTTMERRLRLYGYEVAAVATLEEARALLGTLHVEALIIDVNLDAGQSGLDLLDAIRARRELDHCPVLIFTGAFLSDAEQARIRRHRAHLFGKPEGFDALVKFLDTLTGRDQPH